MKDRLKKKLKAKKILGNNKQRTNYFPQPAKKRKIYEMPPEYKKNLQLLDQLLIDRADYEQKIKFLSPEARAEALPVFRKLDMNIDRLEQALANEYENYQNRQEKIEEAEKNKNKAGSRLLEMTQRMFIVAKHKFEPAEFKKFESNVLKHMTPEQREKFYDEIAIRESYDLENILADPDGSIKRPLKHPHTQLKEAIFEIQCHAYETDDFFKQACAEYEKAEHIRDEAEKDIWLYSPEKREQHRQDIEKLTRQLDSGKQGMMDYLKVCFAEDGMIEIEIPDQEKLDAAFALAKVAHERVFIYYKHCRPDVFEKFIPEATSAYTTPEEIEEFYERIAKREAEELDEILAASKMPH